MFNLNFADDWIQTADLWYWKQPLYQLSHNHCPELSLCLVNVCVCLKHHHSDVYNILKANSKLRIDSMMLVTTTYAKINI